MASTTNHDVTIEGREAADKLGELLDGQRFAMVSTVDDAGRLTARPLSAQQVDGGTLWFFVTATADWVTALQPDQAVGVTYADTKDQRYVAAQGTATIVQDAAKVDELWNPFAEAWFPEGKGDPDLRLLRIDVEHADFWEAPGAAVVRLARMAKALITKDEPDLGQRGDLDLR